GLPASLSRRGHRLRRHQRPAEPRGEAQTRAAQLRAARRTQHAPAHDLSGGGAQPEPGDQIRGVVHVAESDALKQLKGGGRCTVGWTTYGTFLLRRRRPEPMAVDQLPPRVVDREPDLPPVIGPGHTFRSVTDKISSIVLTRRTPPGWVAGFAFSFLFVMLLGFAVGYLLIRGVGIW